MNNFIVFFIFLVFFGAAVLFYSKRLKDDNTDLAPTAKNLTEKPVTGIKPQHVAAITAAILAATHGRGRILSIAPHSRAVSSDASRWRSVAIAESVGRRLAPSWKR